jgi:steroid 5-alpha reductase family enzyme
MILTNILLVFGLMTALWVWSVLRRDVSVVDPWWSIGFLVVTANSARLAGVGSARWLVLAVVALWSLRLWLYLLARSRGKPEDARYTAFRMRYGADRYWWLSYFQVFLLQGTLLLLVSAPLQYAANAPGPDPIGALDLAGAALTLFGAGYEAVADAQLARWKKRPDRGEVMDEGLWRTSRHPNYFGEVLVAWGFWLFAADEPLGVPLVLAPLLMTFLLVRVSGVAMLDEHMARRKPAYRDYMRRTPALIPGFPRATKPPRRDES